MRPPEFLKVSPADIGRVGSLGACILALIRYVTAPPDETNGRRMVDGDMWWRASHDDIGQALGGGLSRRTVSRTVGKLLNEGDLLAIPTDDFYGDRAQAYRAADVPMVKSDQGADLPLAITTDRSANMAKHVGQNRPSTSAKMAPLPLPREVEEEGEKARAAEPEPLDVETAPGHGDAPVPPDPSEEEPQLLDIEGVEPVGRELVAQRIDGVDALVGEVVDDGPDHAPQPYCDRHMPHGTDNSCGACGHRRRARETWQQRQQARLLMTAFSKGAEPAPPVRRKPLPKPEPPSWVPGPDGRPRCRRHGHLPTAPVDCTRCHDAAMAARGSA